MYKKRVNYSSWVYLTIILFVIFSFVFYLYYYSSLEGFATLDSNETGAFTTSSEFSIQDVRIRTFGNENTHFNPNLNDGEEIAREGFKYANRSSVMISSYQGVNCKFKPDGQDDGLKQCELILDLENFRASRPTISTPTFNFPNKTSNEIKDLVMQFTYNYSIKLIEIDNTYLFFNETTNGTERGGTLYRVYRREFSNWSAMPSEIDTSRPIGLKVSYNSSKFTFNQFNFTTTVGGLTWLLDPTQSQCGTIGSSGTYTLNQSIRADETCLDVATTVNDAIVDCAGNNVSFGLFDSASRGIYSLNSKNITIKNCIIYDLNQSSFSNAKYGIQIQNGTNITILNSTIIIIGNNSIGIGLTSGSNYTNISTNNITTIGTDSDGIALDTSSHNIIYMNTVNTSGVSVNLIELFANSSFNNATYNNLKSFGGSGANGIRIDHSQRNLISYNFINGTGEMIYLSNNANSTNISSNVIFKRDPTGGSPNSVYAVTIDISDNVTFEFNHVNNTDSSNAVNLAAGTRYNTINNNRIFSYAGGQNGIAVNGINNIIKDNFINISTSSNGVTISTNGNGSNVSSNIIVVLGGAGIKSVTTDAIISSNRINTTGTGPGIDLNLGDRNNVTSNIIFSTGFGISFTNSPFMTIAFNTINISSSSTLEGIGMSSSGLNINGTNITDNTILNSGSENGIEVDTSANVTIELNRINSTEGAILLRLSTPSARVKNNVITTIGNNAPGISLATSPFSIVNSNTIFTRGSTSTGIQLATSSSNSVVAFNSLNLTGASSGIRVLSNSNSTNISTNYVLQAGADVRSIDVDNSASVRIELNQLNTTVLDNDGRVINIGGRSDNTAVVLNRIFSQGRATLSLNNMVNALVYDNFINISYSSTSAGMDLSGVVNSNISRNTILNQGGTPIGILSRPSIVNQYNTFSENYINVTGTGAIVLGIGGAGLVFSGGAGSSSDHNRIISNQIRINDPNAMAITTLNDGNYNNNTIQGNLIEAVSGYPIYLSRLTNSTIWLNNLSAYSNVSILTLIDNSTFNNVSFNNLTHNNLSNGDEGIRISLNSSGLTIDQNVIKSVSTIRRNNGLISITGESSNTNITNNIVNSTNNDKYAVYIDGTGLNLGYVRFNNNNLSLNVHVANANINFTNVTFINQTVELFYNNLNITSSSLVNTFGNLTTKVNFLNMSSLGTAPFNTSANITFIGTTYDSTADYKVGRDNDDCPSTVCTKLNANPTRFQVTGFSVYNTTQTIEAPRSSAQLANSTNVNLGDAIGFGTYWQDTGGLSSYIFSIDNATGTFENHTVASMTGTSNSSNVTVKVIFGGSGETVSWKIFANDTSGNWNVTDTKTFIVGSVPGSTPAAASQSGGGGGEKATAPEAASVPSEATESSTKESAAESKLTSTPRVTIAANEPKEIAIDNNIVNSLSITTSIDVAVSITVSIIDEKPKEISEPAEVVYKYLDITPSANINDVLKDANVDFLVEKSWINENKLNENNIALFRFEDEKWDELNTEKVSEDATKVYYKSETPGFSLFAIGEKKSLGAGVVSIVKGIREKLGTLGFIIVLSILLVGGAVSTWMFAPSIRKIGSDRSVSIDVKNKFINNINVKTTQDIKTAVNFVKVEAVEKPEHAAQPSRAVYKYLNVRTSIEIKDNLKSANLKFSVDNSWIKENGMENEDVTLFIYGFGEYEGWRPLDTKFLGISGSKINYSADTYGFGLFAIGEKHIDRSWEPWYALANKKGIDSRKVLERYALALGSKISDKSRYKKTETAKNKHKIHKKKIKKIHR